METHRYGLRIGRWWLTWWDLWARRPCFEVAQIPNEKEEAGDGS